MSFAISAVVTGVAVAASTGLAIAGSIESRKANRAARRAENVRAQRERVQALRQNRISQAQIFAQAGNAGVSSSSGVQGAAGALQTSGAINQNFADQINTLTNRQLKAQGNAQTLNEIGGVVSNLGTVATNFRNRP